MASSSSSMYWKGGHAVSPAPPLMTVDEYFTKTPETVRPTELIFGAIRVADSPMPRHQMAVAGLFRALDAHVRERRLGRMWIAPLDVVLHERRALIVQPDLFFVSNERAHIVTDRVRGAPDLVIEVLSPHPRLGRAEERVEWFSEFGVHERWLVHQDRVSLEIIDCSDRRMSSRVVLNRRQSIVSAVLPEFTSSLDDILS